MKRIIYTLVIALITFYNITAQAPPPAPVATTATIVTSSRFYANWDSSSTTTGYYLDVAKDNAFIYFVADYQNIDIGNVLSYNVNSFLTAGTTYYYRVRAYNANGTSDNSNTINLTTIPAIVTNPVAQNGAIMIEDGTTITFTVICTGASGYQWRKDGEDLSDTGSISSSINDTLTLTNISGIYSGSYDCVVTENKGSVISNPVTLITSPMPVELLSFKVQAAENTTLITWSTASETNNDYYTIERSENGIDFNAIGTVSGAGNSNEMLNYKYSDNEISLKDIIYYRLKQTDFDGNYEYIASTYYLVNQDNKAGSIIFSCSPQENVINVFLTSLQDQYMHIAVYDLSGNEILSSDRNIFKGLNLVQVNVNGVAEGLYMVKAEVKGQSFSGKIIITLSL